MHVIVSISAFDPESNSKKYRILCSALFRSVPVDDFHSARELAPVETAFLLLRFSYLIA